MCFLPARRLSLELGRRAAESTSQAFVEMQFKFLRILHIEYPASGHDLHERARHPVVACPPFAALLALVEVAFLLLA
jgi:hypothetical protein